MTMIEMYNTGPLPITVRQLDEAEKETGLKFPDSYRQFMLESNGGIPMFQNFVLKDGGEGSHLSWFFHLLPGDTFDLLYIQRGRKGRLPSGFLSIATDPYSNDICIECTPGANYGSVWFWDHEREAQLFDGVTPDTADNYDLVADSFPEFLACLYERIVDPNNELEGEGVPDPDPVENARLEECMKRLRGLA
ncbi:MAG: hypothetical protein C0473_00490 [Cyanobacteria bacterium DS3.002]|nr:hypothetical protein [Cyanobacteria bacterium DS3.002]MBA4049959.1 hypothetical protein [Cyanobacteria bacterium DS2.008]MBA4075120.1 hypothetical protein [Cyanobacteria bacterium PR.023]